MQEKISTKKIIIMICAAAVVFMAAVILLISNKEEAYRSIMVYELQGSAVIERADIGAIDAAENLYLESGDRVRVEDESMMRMKLDNDKYITAEANTVFSLEAEGNEQDSKTRIALEQGAITNEIQNPLSGESLYETSTPNSVMAVRGTIYRAELYDNGEGEQNMRLCCFEGTVATTPIFPDGSMGEEVLVHAGSELTIYSDGTADAVKDIDYESLPELLSGLVAFPEQEDAAEEAVSEPSESVEDEDVQEAAEDFSVEEDSERVENDSQADSRESNHVQTAQNAGSNKAANQDKSGQKTENTAPASGGTPPVSSGGNSNIGNNGQDSDSGNSDNGNSDQGSGDGNTAGDTDNDSGDKTPKPPKEVTYTVTFKYQGTVFATQSVKKGSKATAPVLAPASAGAWDFDFNTKISANTSIEWKQ